MRKNEEEMRASLGGKKKEQEQKKQDWLEKKKLKNIRKKADCMLIKFQWQKKNDDGDDDEEDDEDISMDEKMSTYDEASIDLYQCFHCNDKFGTNEMEVIGCDLCLCWYHRKCMPNYMQIMAEDNDLEELYFECDYCSYMTVMMIHVSEMKLLFL